MSNEALTWAFDQELPSTEKFVLVVLSDYANQDWRCFPSNRTISRATGLSSRTVTDAVGRLIERGILVIERRFDDRGRQTSNEFVIVREGAALAPSGVQLPQGGGCSSRTLGGAAPAPSKKNPHKNPQKEPALALLAPDDPMFVEFYSAYPRKVGKPKALESFSKVVKHVDPQRVIEAAKLFADQQAGTDKQFIPYPATWLNQGRWDDEVEEVSETPRPPRMTVAELEAKAEREHEEFLAVAREKGYLL